MQHRAPRWAALAALALATSFLALPARADHEPEDGLPRDSQTLREAFEHAREDPSASLAARDAATARALMGDRRSGESGKRGKDLKLRGRGKRLVENATTDVWVHGRYAYTGTFDSPCGGEEGAGVWVWDVRNKNRPSLVDVIPSPDGSRSNDVKVERLNSGTILAHSNEACASGGPGGIELYEVSNPANPEHLASIRADELNPITNELLGGITDVGVHNIWLFRQGQKDYVAIVAESAFDTFRIYDITDPTNPTPVSAWGAEEVFDPGVGDETEDVDRVAEAVNWLLSGFGSSQNRFLHDITINRRGTRAYLSNWDAGLVLLDISDPSDPQLVSVALDQENGSKDGEVNSHAAWPSENGRVVVETEEDFDAWVETQPPGNLTFGEGDPVTPLPGVAVSTSAGDDLEANQTGNDGELDATSLTVTSGPLAGTTYPAIELAGDQPKLADTGPVAGDIVWIGRACNEDPILNADQIADGGIAVVRRGACAFRDKNFNADAAGADAVVIANNLTNTPWGGVRIWDYSDPANPKLAATFDTPCSAAPDPIPQCDPEGTYSVHNVVVERVGKRLKAYISWYWDGMFVLDVTNPYRPKQVARYFDNSPEFLESNGGNPHDFWGVYKVRHRPWIYGSDRNGGLYVFKEQGRRFGN